jgi:cell division protein FtsL
MKTLFGLLLASAVFVSAVEVVVNQHLARKYFVDIQELEKSRDGLIEEWGRLSLEQSTWATDDRIENTAKAQLGMTEPGTNNLVLMNR